jgi:hypothetical protein
MHAGPGWARHHHAFLLEPLWHCAEDVYLGTFSLDVPAGVVPSHTTWLLVVMGSEGTSMPVAAELPLSCLPFMHVCDYHSKHRIAQNSTECNYHGDCTYLLHPLLLFHYCLSATWDLNILL